MMQKKFSLHSSGVNMAKGEGEMTISGGPKWVLPFLRLLTNDHLLFPERGARVTCRIENYAYKDAMGRERVSWIRRFYFPHVTRAFDAVMMYDTESGLILDDLGKSGRLTSPLHVAVSEQNGLFISTNELFINLFSIKLKVPAFLSPIVKVHEYFDDESGRFIVSVSVRQPRIAEIIKYEGSVQTTFHTVSREEIPNDGILPQQERKNQDES
ncbi:DUF4166 domain-containing protein [Salipaludibacillus sp. HK11]|uniref:DUF4166 domain-containing protein n=1 Tax=Salipaludibacillus sp. HK11 TaxID=3394320 RepID=UPI0039FD1E73